MTRTFAREMKTLLARIMLIAALPAVFAGDLDFFDISLSADGNALKADLKNKSESTTYYSAPELFVIQGNKSGKWVDLPRTGFCKSLQPRSEIWSPWSAGD